MQEASDLLPPDALSRILKLLQEFRLSSGFGFVQIHVEHGCISKVGHYDCDKYPFKDNDNLKK